MTHISHVLVIGCHLAIIKDAPHAIEYLLLLLLLSSSSLSVVVVLCCYVLFFSCSCSCFVYVITYVCTVWIIRL